MHEAPVVVFSGGGTGGHLYPALAIADELRALRPDVRAIFVGARRGVEARVLPERGEEHVLLPVEGFDRSRPLRAWRAVVGLGVALSQVARLFRRTRPEVVVVTGGYAGAPAGIAASLAGIPVVLQEQNSIPGLVTRLLSRWAIRVHVAFPEAAARLALPERRVRLSGNPVRSADASDRSLARATFGVPHDAILVLVTGGSQGSLALNRVMGEVVRAGAPRVPPGSPPLHVLWSTGPNHFDSVSRVLAESGAPAWVHALPYIHQMPDALAAADVAVSRAGAMFTAELLNQALPAILVPFPFATADHQTENARSLERAGVAVVMPESGLTGERLAEEISRLIASPDTLAAMRERAHDLARPDAARCVAADVASLLSPAGGGR